LGLAIGYIAFVAIGFVTDWIFGVLWFAFAGFVLGIAQGLVQSRWKVSRVGWWVLATSFGFGVIPAVLEVLGGAVFEHFTQAAAWTVLGTITGASLGIAQWPALRGQVARAGWWVLASTVGLGIGFIVAGIELVSPTSRASGATIGAIYGAFSGGIMVGLLRQQITKEPSLSQDAAELEGGGMKWPVWALMSVGTLVLFAFVLRAPTQARDHLTQASSYIRQGNYDLAIEEYSKAIALDPQDAFAYYNRGYIYRQHKRDYDRAIDDFDQAIALDPESANFNANVYFNRGKAYASKGNIDQAIADIERAIELSPSAGSAQVYESALEEIEKMRQRATTPIDPSPPTGTLDLANCEQLAGWAWDPKTPNQPIEVQIYDLQEDGTAKLLVRTTAGLPRPDLPPVLGDNGNHGFSIPPPVALRDGLSHTVRAVAVNSDARFPDPILNGSDVTVRCP
jgi:hypothetical protein